MKKKQSKKKKVTRVKPTRIENAVSTKNSYFLPLISIVIIGILSIFIFRGNPSSSNNSVEVEAPAVITTSQTQLFKEVAKKQTKFNNVCLSQVSYKIYGSSRYWPVIYYLNENKSFVQSPDVVRYKHNGQIDWIDKTKISKEDYRKACEYVLKKKISSRTRYQVQNYLKDYSGVSK